MDTGFVAEDVPDQPPTVGQLSAARGGGVDLNKPPSTRDSAAVLALAAAPSGFTFAQLTAEAGVDHDQAGSRIDMQTLFNDPALKTQLAA